MLTVSIALEPVLEPAAIHDAVRLAFFAGNLVGPSVVAYLLLQYFVRERDRERARSERLLLNVLPSPIADRLKRHEGADRRPVCRGDGPVRRYRRLHAAAADLPPEDVVRLLNAIFSDFDGLADKYGLEKIKTIGDAYMVVGGLQTRVPITLRPVAFALDVLHACRFAPGTGTASASVGINTGPTVAGVIGRRKFIYDLWGDTVNTASRMESQGIPGSIQVTAQVHDHLGGRYRLQPRETINAKGKGTHPHMAPARPPTHSRR